MRAALEGLLAGWAIAVPVGAIGVLIVDRAATRGLGVGAAAALGTACADFFYATIAVVVGSAIAAAAPDLDTTQAVSAGVLAAVGMWLLVRALRPVEPPESAPAPRRPAATTATFFGLTVINPVTVVYFAALVAGFDTAVIASSIDRVVFAVAAFVASLSWQLALAGFGAVVGSRLSQSAARLFRIAGGIAVLGFAARTAVQAWR